MSVFPEGWPPVDLEAAEAIVKTVKLADELSLWGISRYVFYTRASVESIRPLTNDMVEAGLLLCLGDPGGYSSYIITEAAEDWLKTRD